LRQVLEDALQGVVEGLDAKEARAEAARDRGHGSLEKRDVARADPQPALGVDLD
jgi:hypothetical protein